MPIAKLLRDLYVISPKLGMRHRVYCWPRPSFPKAKTLADLEKLQAPQELSSPPPTTLQPLSGE